MRRPGLHALVVLGLAACSAPSTPAPTLTQVRPPQVDELSGGPVELHGTHLKPAVKLDLDRPAASEVNDVFVAWLERDGGRTDLADVTWLGDGVVAATVPAGVGAGRFDVHLVVPRGREAVLLEGLELVDCFSTTCLLPDGGPDAGWVPCGDFTFEDLDLDGVGRPDSGAFLCGPYRANVDGDCNDGDREARPGAPEVCNALDDDCDGQVDDGACPDAGPGFLRVSGAGTTEQDWETAWSWARGALWVAGEDHVWVRRDGGAFTAASGNCPNNISTCWAEPSGRGYFSGGNLGIGRVSAHDVNASGCAAYQQLSDPVTGLIGFPVDDGGVELVGVLRNGRTARGTVELGGQEYPSNLSSNFRFEDLHGVGPTTLYAVGYDSAVNPPRMKAFRFGADGGWVDERVERLPGIARGGLRAVWVLDAERVVAVGDDGTVLERTPFGWFRITGLTASDDLTAVRAFSLGRVYVAQQEGFIRRWNGQGWDTLYDGGQPLRDLTGTAEDDVWGVGPNGVVVHWPQPP